MAGNSAARVLRLPITNVWTGGRYCADVAIGGGCGALARMVLDTGSSSLVVDPAVYNGDPTLGATSLAQLITYGAGGWAGPVVETGVRLRDATSEIALARAPLAIALVHEGSLGAAGGILGLAYGADNPAWDFAPTQTWPWPFGRVSLAQSQAELGALARTRHLSQTSVTPLIDALVGAGLIANLFAFHTQRSVASARRGRDPVAQAADPLNNGTFVLGGGPAEADLFDGEFVTVALAHDLFYNLTLTSVRVGAGAPHAAAPLQARYRATLASNAILDSGADQLSLATDVHQAVLAGLAQAGPAFSQAVQAAQHGQPVAGLLLDAWPTLYFTFLGPAGEAVELAVAPHTYWQADAPVAGQASFRIGGPLMSPANQSNFGLPLMNNYYTVFDRSAGPRGVVRFAPLRL